MSALSQCKRARVEGECVESVVSGYVLYGYWRSSASWRVRLALGVKGISYESQIVNLLKGEQHHSDYSEKNALGVIPTLQLSDGRSISESMAIMEYLEEIHPEVPILPTDAYLRARCRQLALISVSDIHPVQNLKVLNRVAAIGGESAKLEWAKYWIEQGLAGLELETKKSMGKFSVGDQVSMADITLVPQLYNARRWGADMNLFPTLLQIEAALSELPAFISAHPDKQPDAVAAPAPAAQPK